MHYVPLEQRKLPVRRSDPAERAHRAHHQRGHRGDVGHRLASATQVASIHVGAALSHPAGVVVNSSGTRAYVALSNADQVAVVNLSTRQVVRTISLGSRFGSGTQPVAPALGPSGNRLFVAESGADAVAAIRLPGKGTPARQAWSVVGRIPTAEQPEAVLTSSATRRPARATDLDRGPRGRHRAASQGPQPCRPERPDLLGLPSAPPTEGRHLRAGDTVRGVRAQGAGRPDGASLRRADRGAHAGGRR